MRRPIITVRGVQFKENVIDVGHGGIATTMVQVLKSSFGYYIGRLWFDDEFGQFIPIPAVKRTYWKTREQAEKILIDKCDLYNNI
jgi:hypothetical protein